MRVCKLKREYEEVELAKELTQETHRHDMYLQIAINDTLYSINKDTSNYDKDIETVLDYIK